MKDLADSSFTHDSSADLRMTRVGRRGDLDHKQWKSWRVGCQRL